MLQSTEIEIKMGELRTELRALMAGPPADDATEEVRAKHDTDLADGTAEARRSGGSEDARRLKAEDLIAGAGA